MEKSDADFSLLEKLEGVIPTSFPEGNYFPIDSGLIRNQEFPPLFAGQENLHCQMPKKRGRKSDPLTIFLSNFIREKSTRPLKAEYLYAQMIRGHQRTMRSIAESLSSEDNTAEKALDIYWQELEAVYSEDPEVFDLYCSINYSPHSRFKSQRRFENRSRSFNKDFCRSYFKKPIMRKSFHYYVNYLFTGSDPTSLSEHFNAKCCHNDSHPPSCDVKWNQFKKCIQEHFMTRLDLEPFFYDDDVPIVFQSSKYFLN